MDEDSHLEMEYEDRFAIDGDDWETEQDWDDDDGLSDVEADAMTLAGAGWGTDEDYGYYGEEY